MISWALFLGIKLFNTERSGHSYPLWQQLTQKHPCHFPWTEEVPEINVKIYLLLLVLHTDTQRWCLTFIKCWSSINLKRSNYIFLKRTFLQGRLILIHAQGWHILTGMHFQKASLSIPGCLILPVIHHGRIWTLSPTRVSLRQASR